MAVHFWLSMRSIPLSGWRTFWPRYCAKSGELRIEWENMNYSAERMLEIFGARHSAKVKPAEAAMLAHKPVLIAERVYGLGNPSKAAELGNTHRGDGFLYRGGGLMQTTGRANYKRMGQLCGFDFENHPDLVVSAEEHALKPALGEWSQGKLNQFADQDDVLSISKAISFGKPAGIWYSQRPRGAASPARQGKASDWKRGDLDRRAGRHTGPRERLGPAGDQASASSRRNCTAARLTATTIAQQTKP